jgi:hypothetical protein
MLFNDIVLQLQNYPKYKEVQQVQPAPIVHAGFPGNFNLSLSEYEETAITGGNSILNQDHNILMTKVQPCLRFNDIKENFYSPIVSKYHLGVFHMADVSGYIHLLDQSNKRQEIAKFTITNILKFLIEIVGLDQTRLRISYFGSGKVVEVTKGKYNFEFNIPQDPFLEHWLDYGLNIDNMFIDNSRNTFLALNIYGKPTPWGYRNEIHYELKDGTLLDIGTVENCFWRPRFDELEIVGLEDYEGVVSVNAVGVERLEIASEGLNSILHLSSIDKFNKKLIQFGIGKIDDRLNLLRIFQALSIISLYNNQLSEKQSSKRVELIFFLKQLGDKYGIEKIIKACEWFVYVYNCTLDYKTIEIQDQIFWEITKRLLNVRMKKF